jgi:hypothetical protein
MIPSEHNPLAFQYAAREALSKGFSYGRYGLLRRPSAGLARLVLRSLTALLAPAKFQGVLLRLGIDRIVVYQADTMNNESNPR